jgi:hypothetical protein
MIVKAWATTLLVLAVSLLTPLPATAATPELSATGNVSFFVDCEGFTTPVWVSTFFVPVDLYLPSAWSSKIDQDSGVMKTTLEAAGIDGAGVSFTVSAKFELQGVLIGGVWRFNGYGTGRVKITREDGAKAIAEGLFVRTPHDLAPVVFMESGKCLRI